MSKYYTPTIEEFHVGFIHEYVNTNTATWYSTQIDVSMEIKAAEQTLEYFPERLRVKHLDRKDIESLGWVNKRSHGHTSFFIEKKDGDNSRDYKLCYMFEDNPSSLVILKADKAWVMGTSKWRPIFSGDIKNKSELKRILKQIGI